MTYSFYSIFLKEKEKKDEIKLQSIISNVEKDILHKIDIYESALRGGIAFIESSKYNVSSDEWSRFISLLKIKEKYPGIHGMGIIYPSLKNETKSFLKKMEINGIKNFKIHTIQDFSHNDQFIISYIEPFIGNEKARGLDLGSEKKRRNTAELSRDSGESAITEKITLVQGTGKDSGFLFLVPFYRKNMMDFNSVEERRNNFIGWIYAPFINKEFFKNIIDKYDKEIEIVISDTNDFSEDSILYFSNLDSQKDYLTTIYRKTQVKIANHYFYIGWIIKPAFYSEESKFVNLIILCAIIITILLSVIFYAFKNSNQKSLKLVKERTRELRLALIESKRATQIKSQFLASMSHEIRTPMNGILGMTTMLLDTELKNDQKNMVSNISNCCNSLLTIINDILDFSKVESGKIILEKMPFNVFSTTNEVISILTNNAKIKNNSIIIENNTNFLGWVIGDDTRIKQILFNLIGNAIKFTNNGEIKITIDNKKTNNFQEILFKIKDSGIGISKEDGDKLFKPFSQVDGSTTKKFGGTGLGLSISKGLIEQMGGSIWYESEVGKGSSFSFKILLEETTPVHKEISLNKKSYQFNNPTTDLKILVADDNRVNQIVAQSFLTKLGYKSDVAGNGKEVLSMLSEKKYDLIFMDCHMPEMDGFEATKLIKSNEKFKDTLIIAMTASAMKQDMDACFEAGMDEFISKPVNLDTLDSLFKNKIRKVS